MPKKTPKENPLQEAWEETLGKYPSVIRDTLAAGWRKAHETEGQRAQTDVRNEIVLKLNEALMEGGAFNSELADEIRQGKKGD